jgi:hypothetical protein
MEAYHVLPINDTKEHEEESVDHNCWCNPEIEENDIGNLVIIHNSADGREWTELRNIYKR